MHNFLYNEICTALDIVSNYTDVIVLTLHFCVILQHYPYIGPEARECTQCSTSRTRSHLLAEVFASNRLDMSKQYMDSTLFQYEVVDDLVLSVSSH